jgi:hypothetical protein
MFTENEKNKIKDVKDTIKFHMEALKNFDWWKMLYENDAVYLSGGAIGSLLRGEIPKDWDFYFYDQDSAVTFKEHIEKNYDDEIKEVNINYMEHADNNGKMITANAITMKTDDSFIFTFAGHPNDVRNHFDFVHCKPYYLLMQDKLFISREQYDACMNKKLIYNTDIKFIKEWRLQKFKNKGFTFHDQSAY